MRWFFYTGLTQNVIASLRRRRGNPVFRLVAFLDCFATLAMTGVTRKFCYSLTLFFIIASVQGAHAASPILSPGSVGAMGIIEPKSRVLTLTHRGSMEPVTVDVLFVGEGQSVPAGTPLAQLGNHAAKKAELEEAKARVVRLKAQLRQTQVTESFTRKEFERRKILQRQQAISASEKDETEKNWQTAVSQAEALRAEIVEAEASRDVAIQNLEDTLIRAPFAGTVLDILTRSGERASDKGIMTFADLSAMDVRAEVFETDVARLKTAQKAEIFLPQQIIPLKGYVYHIGFLVRGNDVNDTDPLADRDNRVVSVRIAVNPESAPLLRNQIYKRVSVRFVP